MVPVVNSGNIGPYNSVPRRARPMPSIPGMGWTGGFTIPGNETRFSARTCTGSDSTPMSANSDLVCGRAGEVSYLNRIGCTAVGFQGSHHCNTDQGNEGLFFCCPPGVLDNEAVSSGGGLPSGIVLGIGALAAVGIGIVLWDHLKTRREEEDRPALYGYSR